MPGGKNDPVKPVSSREVISTRFLAAMRDAVFGAFSDPEQLAQWWGPKGFTNKIHQFDFSPGGVWRFTMHGPDGAAYEMHKQFTEIVRPERIVVRHIQQKHDFTLTMTFAARDDGTEITWRMCFDDPAECTRVRDFIVPANEENFDRLATHLARTTPNHEHKEPTR